MSSAGPQHPVFLASRAANGPQAPDAGVALVGVPYDGAVSFRRGAAGAPRRIREASDSIESYCPLLDMDLEDEAVADLGDVALAEGLDPAAVLGAIATATASGALPTLAVGGDHLVSLPFMERMLDRHRRLQIVHLDAHLDMRDTWEGQAHSHATVMRRVLERMGPEAALLQWGIRSGTREEFRLARADARITRFENTAAGGEALCRELARRGEPVYVTLDADVLDPSQMPGTGNPEPAGLGYAHAEALLVELVRRGVPVVGADLVEVAPDLDPSGVTAVVGARLARTLLLALAASRQITLEA